MKPGYQSGEDFLGEIGEMIGLPVESGVVGGDKIHQMFDLLLGTGGFQQGTILVIGSNPQVFETLPETIGEEGLLVLTQVDPTVLIHQIHDGPVGLCRQGTIVERMHCERRSV
jgi:hypothetical protein